MFWVHSSHRSLLTVDLLARGMPRPKLILRPTDRIAKQPINLRSEDPKQPENLPRIFGAAPSFCRNIAARTAHPFKLPFSELAVFGYCRRSPHPARIIFLSNGVYVILAVKEKNFFKNTN